MSQSKHRFPTLIGAAITTSTLLAGGLFSMDTLAHGYMQDSAKKTMSEGRCGEGKCGAGMKTNNKKEAPAAGAQTKQQGGHTLAGMDTDKDGRISRAEFAAAHGGKDTMFPKIDSNSDGFISKEEFDAHHAAMKKDKAATEGKCGEGKCGGKM